MNRHSLWIVTNKLFPLAAAQPELDILVMVAKGSGGTAVSEIRGDMAKVRTKQITEVSLRYFGKDGIKPLKYFADWFGENVPEVKDPTIKRMDVIELRSPPLRVVFRSETSHCQIMRGLFKDGFPNEQIWRLKKMAEGRLFDAKRNVSGLISTEFIAHESLGQVSDDPSLLESFRAKHPHMLILVEKDGRWVCREQLPKLI